MAGSTKGTDDSKITTFISQESYALEQITILCSRLSFLRKQESSLRASRLWMPDHVRHDESLSARLQLIVKRARAIIFLLMVYLSPTEGRTRLISHMGHLMSTSERLLSRIRILDPTPEETCFELIS